MKTTSVYGIPYIEADDLVSSAPTQFRQTAEGVEKVLREIDARATPEGVSPVTATTLETLESLEGVNGQSGVVTGDTMQRNGLYYRLGDAWHPVEIRQKRTWGCRFKRSANDLILNNGDTYMMFSNVTGSADIKTTSNSKGAYAILPAGRWLVKEYMQFSGIADMTWLSIGVATVGGASSLLTSAAESSTSGNAFSAIECVTVIESDGTGGIQVSFHSNNSGIMRVAGYLNVVEL